MSKQKKGRKLLFTALMFVLGVALGVAIDVFYLIPALESGESFWIVMLTVFGYLALFLLAYVLQLVIHEAGHLLFGLLTGYRFLSFRIGSLTLVKRPEGLRLCRYALAGTAGQCLLSPPDLVDEKMPVILYNLGGVLLNLLTGAAFLALSFLAPGTLPGNFLGLLALTGAAIALMNGVPIHTPQVDNDGYNALALTRDRETVKAFWTQMKCMEQTALGRRLRDLPEEWFQISPTAMAKSALAATVGALACNRLLDAGDVEGTARAIDRLLSSDAALAGVHRNLLLLDRVFCATVLEDGLDTASMMEDPQMRSFRRSMHGSITALRTEMVYALLVKKDPEEAEKLKIKFEKAAKAYPYPADVASERMLLALAQEKYEKRSELHE